MSLIPRNYPDGSPNDPGPTSLQHTFGVDRRYREAIAGINDCIHHMAETHDPNAVRKPRTPRRQTPRVGARLRYRRPETLEKPEHLRHVALAGSGSRNWYKAPS
jgi:hypothetical protein